MKKVLSSVLILVLSLFLFGCSGTPLQNQQPNPPQQNNQEFNNDLITNTDSEETKTDTGRFSGRIDNNFIEIKISGVPDQIAAREFMLSEELKASFEKMNLKINDEIKMRYRLNEHDQRMIIQIERL